MGGAQARSIGALCSPSPETQAQRADPPFGGIMTGYEKSPDYGGWLPRWPAYVVLAVTWAGIIWWMIG